MIRLLGQLDLLAQLSLAKRKPIALSSNSEDAAEKEAANYGHERRGRLCRGGEQPVGVRVRH